MSAILSSKKNYLTMKEKPTFSYNVIKRKLLVTLSIELVKMVRRINLNVWMVVSMIRPTQFLAAY